MQDRAHGDAPDDGAIERVETDRACGLGPTSDPRVWQEACRGLDDDELLSRLKSLMTVERTGLAALLVHLGEVDHRRLHEPRGYPSLFVYCTRKLGYSEQAAYKRIYSARLCRDYPEILAMIEDGRIHMAALMVIGAHLTADNHRELLEASAGKSRRHLEMMVASMDPRPDRADRVQRLGVSHWRPAPLAAGGGPAEAASPPGGSAAPLVGSATPFGAAAGGLPDASLPPGSWATAQFGWSLGPRAEIEHLSTERVRFHFTAGLTLLRQVERAREILRHKHPDGRLEGVFQEGMDELLRRRDPDLLLKLDPVAGGSKRGRGPRPTVPGAGSGIPRRVRTTVWQRDGGTCSYVAPDGTRCGSRDSVQYDHVVPRAEGGRSDSVGNIRLLCGAHNRMSAREILAPRGLPPSGAQTQGSP